VQDNVIKLYAIYP